MRKGKTRTCVCAFDEPGRLSPPIWPCTTRGFPCLRHCCRSGGLLPHLFTLTKQCVGARLAPGACVDPSQVSLLHVTALHSAGGLFSVALSVSRCASHHGSKTRHYQRPNSPDVIRRVALIRHRLLRAYDDGVRTFLPLQPLTAACADVFGPRPAITRLTRCFHYSAGSTQP